MNFKNISLFMLLTGFVGAGIHAEGEFKEMMPLGQKLACKRVELEGLEDLNKAYSRVGIHAQYECSTQRKVDLSEDSELCMYAKEIFKKQRKNYNKITKLIKEIEKLELERDEKLEQDLEQDIVE
ncbi:MAG TPA: hypothetical protein VKR54_03695 [Candidatus Babeliales bacterium]|nr:hypothetical protein [Candidatus Babeliales bacterium]